MTWDNKGNLFCNWCGKTVILAEKATAQDKVTNTGWTKCYECVHKQTPFPKEGKIEDLPDDYTPKILCRMAAGKFDPMRSAEMLYKVQDGVCLCRDEQASLLLNSNKKRKIEIRREIARKFWIWVHTETKAKKFINFSKSHFDYLMN